MQSRNNNGPNADPEETGSMLEVAWLNVTHCFLEVKDYVQLQIVLLLRMRESLSSSFGCDSLVAESFQWVARGRINTSDEKKKEMAFAFES